MLINYHLTHNLKVVGSNPTPATKQSKKYHCVYFMVFSWTFVFTEILMH